MHTDLIGDRRGRQPRSLIQDLVTAPDSDPMRLDSERQRLRSEQGTYGTAMALSANDEAGAAAIDWRLHERRGVRPEFHELRSWSAAAVTLDRRFVGRHVDALDGFAILDVIDVPTWK